MKYCDMHIHTTHSDGILTTEQILMKAQSMGMAAISITDHQTIEAYKDMKKARSVFSGKIIPGCEVFSIANNIPIEILAYGIDLEKFNVNDNMIKIKSTDFEVWVGREAIKILQKIDKDFEVDMNRLNYAYYKVIYERAKKSDKIRNAILSEDKSLLNDYTTFFRKGFNNPRSIFYLNRNKIFASYKKVCKYIHSCGGLAFLAHPMRYQEYYLDILNEVFPLIDGIECYHPSTKEHLDELVTFAQKHGKLISGGSDYHGDENHMNQMKFTVEQFKPIEERIDNFI